MPKSIASIEIESMRKRAVELGNSQCSFQEFQELLKLLQNPAPIVRRAAASAIEKQLMRQTGYERVAYLTLLRAIQEESHDQVQQYELRALRWCAHLLNNQLIADITDIARNPNAKPYVRDIANEVVAKAEQALKAAESRLRHWCSRCKTPISAKESELSIERYGKPYCHHCQDERELEDKNFEREVEGAKRLRTTNAVAIRPDFYLPEFDLYIEYWGMDTQDYLSRKSEKRFLYQRAGKKLISLDYRDFDKLEAVLAEKLSRYIRL